MEKRESRNISKSLLKGTLVAGALFTVSSLSAATTSSLFDYDAMGSGSQVRGEILNSPLASSMNNYNMTAGESKTQEANCGENKTKDATCGEKTKRKPRKRQKKKVRPKTPTVAKK